MVDTERILVVFKPGSRGEDAVNYAASLARADGAQVTVVTLAPVQAAVRCGPSDRALEDAVVAAAERELSLARRLLDELGVEAAYSVLRDADARGVARYIDDGGFSAVLLPGDRGLGGGVSARRLRRAVAAPVRIGGAAPMPRT